MFMVEILLNNFDFLPELRAAVALGFRPQQHREHRLMSCLKVKKRL
jgi:hypothetical protein